MKEKGTLYLLVGIPGSGKSTTGRQYGKIYSSDGIRKEFFGSEAAQFEPKAAKKYLAKKGIRLDHLSAGSRRKKMLAAANEMVFTTLEKRVKKALEKGEDAVYDATNIKASSRKDVLKALEGSYDKAVAVFVDTPLETALQRNASRNRHVPRSVIENMHRSLEKPELSEGFDEIITIKPNENE